VKDLIRLEKKQEKFMEHSLKELNVELRKILILLILLGEKF
jgi:hypothetical protein